MFLVVEDMVVVGFNVAGFFCLFGLMLLLLLLLLLLPYVSLFVGNVVSRSHVDERLSLKKIFNSTRFLVIQHHCLVHWSQPSINSTIALVCLNF